MDWHLTKLTHLSTWSETHNDHLWYFKEKQLSARHPELARKLHVRLGSTQAELFLDVPPTTLHLIPALCRNLQSLRSNSFDISVHWVLKTLVRNSSLSNLRLDAGLFVSETDRGAAEYGDIDRNISFPQVTTFHLALSAHPAPFAKLRALDVEHPWRRLFFASDHLWVHETKKTVKNARFAFLLRKFPNLRDLTLELGGSNEIPRLLDALKLLPPLRSFSLRFAAPDSSLRGFANGILESIAVNSATSLVTLRFKDILSAWNECPLSTDHCLASVSLFSQLRELRVHARAGVNSFDCLTSLRTLTKLSVFKGYKLLDTLAEPLRFLTSLQEIDLTEEIDPRGPRDEASSLQGFSLLQGLSLLPNLRRTSIEAWVKISDPSFRFESIVAPAGSIQEAVAVTFAADVPLTVLDDMRNFKHLLSLNIEHADWEGDVFNLSRLLNQLPVLRRLFLSISLSELSLAEPFYHEHLQKLTLYNRARQGLGLQNGYSFVRALAFSLPRLEHYWIAPSSQTCPGSLLDLICGFPQLKSGMAATSAEQVSGFYAALLKRDLQLQLPHFGDLHFG